MGAIEGWWAGSQRVPGLAAFHSVFGDVSDLSELAQRATVPDLVSRGVPEALARRWVTAPAEVSVGRALTYVDPCYPQALRTEHALGPPVLAVEGAPALLDESGDRIGIIGTRRCSGAGAAVARRLAHGLARRGIVVVSGLASGIDAAAHRGALDGSVASTIAVLGHGLGTTYPAAHRDLRRRIVGRGGAVVSGWPDDKRPERWTFPMRNRWVAALCHDLVIVEAPERSGALITAELALSMGRTVWVVPGPSGSPQYAGSHALLSRGLREVHERNLQLEMIMEAQVQGRPSLGPYPRTRGVVRVLEDPTAFISERTGACVSSAGPAWLERLVQGESVESVAQTSSLSLVDLYAQIGALELEGRLVALPGGRYAPGAAPDPPG